MAEITKLKLEIDTSEITELLQRLVAATDRAEKLLERLTGSGNCVTISHTGSDGQTECVTVSGS